MIASIVIGALTLIGIILSVVLFPSIKIGKKDISTFWIVAMLGAVILLIINISNFKEISTLFISDSSVNPLKILVLFFSMTLLSIFLDEVGLFKFLASYAIKKAGKNQLSLYIVVYFLFSILTIFTSNDIVILTFTPFIIYFCKNANINPIPYLVGEFAAANTWSMMLIIGNPTNIYLATSAGINFGDYFKNMALPTLISGIFELLLLLFIFRKSLKQQITGTCDVEHIKSKSDLTIGLILLIGCLISLVLSSYVIKLDMWLITLCFAVILVIYVLITSLVRKNTSNLLIFKHLPYQLIPFVLSMAIVVSVFEIHGVSEWFFDIFGERGITFVYGYTSYFSSNILNNIPMSILYSSIVSNFNGENLLSATYASIIGSNVGAFLMPIGALAGIMFTSIVKKNDVKYSFVDFMKYGIIISLPTISVALLILYLL